MILAYKLVPIKKETVLYLSVNLLSVLYLSLIS